MVRKISLGEDQLRILPGELLKFLKIKILFLKKKKSILKYDKTKANT